MITPKEFSKKTGISYATVRNLAQEGEIRCVISPGGNISIYDSELDRYCNPQNYINIDQYNKVLAENMRLKTILETVHQIVNESEKGDQQ